MLRKGEDETVELECPECGVRVKATVAEAERGKVRCPRGHDVIVMGMLGGAGVGGKTER